MLLSCRVKFFDSLAYLVLLVINEGGKPVAA